MTTTPAMARGAEALSRSYDGPGGPLDYFRGAAHAAVSAALHDPDDDVIAGVLRTHRIECTGIEGVTCRECRDLGWMGRWAFARHQADAVRAAILGGV